jgi:hypothetical protein
MAVTGLDLVTAAMREIGALGADGPASGSDADFVLGKLNRLLDNWRAEGRNVPSRLTLTSSVTLVSGMQDAITLTLAESLASPFQVGVSSALTRDAGQARARIDRADVPNVTSADSGMPAGPTGTYMNYLNRVIT